MKSNKIKYTLSFSQHFNKENKRSAVYYWTKKQSRSCKPNKEWLKLFFDNHVQERSTSEVVFCLQDCRFRIFYSIDSFCWGQKTQRNLSHSLDIIMNYVNTSCFFLITLMYGNKEPSLYNIIYVKWNAVWVELSWCEQHISPSTQLQQERVRIKRSLIWT
jgi:hypothetical protein